MDIEIINELKEVNVSLSAILEHLREQQRTKPKIDIRKLSSAASEDALKELREKGLVLE